MRRIDTDLATIRRIRENPWFLVYGALKKSSQPQLQDPPSRRADDLSGVQIRAGIRSDASVGIIEVSVIREIERFSDEFQRRVAAYLNSLGQRQMMKLMARIAQIRMCARRVAEREIIRLRERGGVEPLLRRLFLRFRVNARNDVGAQIADDPAGVVEQRTNDERRAALPRGQPAQAPTSEYGRHDARHRVVMIEQLFALAEREFIGITELHRMRHVRSRQRPFVAQIAQVLRRPGGVIIHHLRKTVDHAPEQAAGQALIQSQGQRMPLDVPARIESAEIEVEILRIRTQRISERVVIKLFAVSKVFNRHGVRLDKAANELMLAAPAVVPGFNRESARQFTLNA